MKIKLSVGNIDITNCFYSSVANCVSRLSPSVNWSEKLKNSYAFIPLKVVSLSLSDFHLSCLPLCLLPLL